MKFLENIQNAVIDAKGKVGLSIERKKPEIFLVLGLGAVVAGTVMACKATLKVNEILDEHHQKMDEIHEAVDISNNRPEEERTEENTLSEKEAGAATFRVFACTSMKFVKLYSPAVVMGGLGIGMILYSHKLMSERNLALAAAYAVMDKSFKDYRESVKEELGEDVDDHFMYGMKPEEKVKKVIDENTGEEKDVVESVVDIPTRLAPYAKFYDESNPHWDNNSFYNKDWLVRMQKVLSDNLRIRGCLFLNEAYRLLGIPETISGQSIGWVHDRNREMLEVDFGLNLPINARFMAGEENVAVLVFNVDGDILAGNMAGLDVA